MSDQGYVAWPVPGVPYASMHVPLRDSYVAEDGKTYEYTDEELVERAHDLALKLFRAFPPPKAPQGAQRPQGNAGGQGQGRAARFTAVPDEQCDQCNGPVGLKPQTGAQTSDSIVCLTRCTDPNPNGQDYVHRVRWADSQPASVGADNRTGGDIDPNDLPFHHPPSLDRW